MLHGLVETYVNRVDVYLRFLSDLTSVIHGFNAAGLGGYQYLDGYGYRSDFGASFSWLQTLHKAGPSDGILYLLSARGIDSNQYREAVYPPNVANGAQPFFRRAHVLEPEVGLTVAYQNEVAYVQIDNSKQGSAGLAGARPVFMDTLVKTWTMQCGIEYISKSKLDTQALSVFARLRDLRNHIEGQVFANVGLQSVGYVGIGIRHSFGL
jgi:hypothetical protein